MCFSLVKKNIKACPNCPLILYQGRFICIIIPMMLGIMRQLCESILKHRQQRIKKKWQVNISASTIHIFFSNYLNVLTLTLATTDSDCFQFQIQTFTKMHKSHSESFTIHTQNNWHIIFTFPLQIRIKNSAKTACSSKKFGSVVRRPQSQADAFSHCQEETTGRRNARDECEFPAHRSCARSTTPF